MCDPYPFHSLPRVSRRAVVLLRRFAGRLPRLRTEAAVATVEKLLGTEVSFEMPVPEICPADAVAERTAATVSAVLESSSAGAPSRLVVDFPPQLVAAVVDRMLGGNAENALARSVLPLDDLSRGVFAYALARFGQSLDSEWRLSEVLTEQSASPRAESGDCVALAWPIRVHLGPQPHTVRLWVPESAAPALAATLPASGAGCPLLDALLGVEVKLVAKGGEATLENEELRSLRPGDVVVVDRSALQRGEQHWTGAADVMLLGARRALWRCSVENRTLRVDSIQRSEELAMGQGQTKTQHSREDLIKLAGDAPLELTVELARFTLPLEEVANLQPGIVLTTGRPVGESVTLRAGGHAFASGELVDVDGEVGVRILRAGETGGVSQR